jgi:hypothetical protein
MGIAGARRLEASKFRSALIGISVNYSAIENEYLTTIVYQGDLSTPIGETFGPRMGQSCIAFRSKSGLFNQAKPVISISMR